MFGDARVTLERQFRVARYGFTTIVSPNPITE